MPKFGRHLKSIACVGAMALLLVGCSSADPRQDLIDFVTVDIEDADRSKRLQELSVKLEQDIDTMAEALYAADRRLRELNLNYDTTDDEFFAFFEEAAEERARHQDAVLDTMMAMHEVTTPDEWKRLSQLQIDWIVAKTRAASPL